MSEDDRDRDAHRLSRESYANDDPTGWFERLYAEASEGRAVVPWDRGGPHELLVEWAVGQNSALQERVGSGRALVVGSGPGNDAEFVAGLGFDTTAFDISESAVRAAQERYPHSLVDYRVASLFDLPAEWVDAFDLVVEIMTVQSLPEPWRGRAIGAVPPLVGPAGILLVIATGREADDAVDGPPWPLTRDEINAFVHGDLQRTVVEDVRKAGQPSHRRWRAEFRRPKARPATR